MSWIVRYHDNAPPTSNMVALAVWPTWIAVAVTETIRKVISYVLTRPGRELLFTVVSLDEKYKAKVNVKIFLDCFQFFCWFLQTLLL
jgi:hypothetical protein